MTKVGTGYVAVDADLDPFWRRVHAEMAKLNAEFGRVGKSASRSFGDGIDDKGISRSVNRVRSSLTGLDRDSRRASKGFAGLVSSFGGGNDGIRRVARSLDDFGGAAGGTTATIGGFRIALAGLIPIMVSFGGATVAAASSLGPLIGLAAGAGNALASAGQGLGVFKLATAGISDALKEQTSNQLQAGSAAVSSASQQRSAARAIQSAQDGIRSATDSVTVAQRDARQAQRDLSQARTDSRRALVDMRSSLVDATIAEQRAILGLRDAKVELSKTLQGATPQDLEQAQAAVTAGALDQTQAVLNLQKAQRDLATVNATATSTDADRAQAAIDVARAQEALAAAQRDGRNAAQALATLKAGPTDEQKKQAALNVAAAEAQVVQTKRDRIRQEKALTAAEKAGVEGSQQVVAARQAVADADKRVRDAQRDVQRATQALSDAQLSASEAMTKGGLAAGKLNQKMSTLPPAAQAFVRELISMKPRLDALRATAASGFFPGATAGLRAATASFVPLQHVVAATSRVLGGLALRAGELVGSSGFGRDLETIGTRNARVIDTLGGAALHLVSALRHVMVAAGPLTQWLADTVNKWALQAAAAAKSGRETGKMAAFFEHTRQIAERLGSIIGHVASGLFGLGKVGKVTGDQIWASIDRAAGRFDAWANSARGHRELQDFFRQSKELASALLPVLGGITSAIGALVLRTLPLASLLRVLGPYSDEATTAFVAYKLAVIAVAAAENVATGAAKAHELWTNRMTLSAIRWRFALLAATVATVASSVATAAATAVTGGLVTAFWALDAAMAANPIGLVVVAIAGLVAAFVLLGGHLSWITTAFSAVWNVITAGASAVLGFLSAHWPLILAILTGPIGLAVLAIVRNWDAIKAVTVAVWDAIKASLTAVWNAIKAVATAVFHGIRDVITGVWNAIRASASAAWSAIRTSAGVAWDGIRLAILTPIRLARDTLKTIWDAIGSVATGAWNGIKTLIGKAAGPIRDVIESPFKLAAKGVAKFAKLILSVIDLIPGVDMKGPKADIDNFVKGLAKGGVFSVSAQGLAHGGAFARTGGIVNTPITLLGEEAPRMPEFVIPTNPAYRKRAQMLLAQAAGAIGFAQGGVWSKSELMALWKQVNPDLGDPNLMAAIALAESSGRQSIVNSIGAGGLWQIYPPEPGYLDPVTNARIAGRKLRMQGLDAWTVYTSGAYRKFLGDGGGGGGILGAIGGVIKDIGGTLGKLLSQGASFLLDKLPGVGDLPDWLKGAGKYALGKAGGWIKDQVAGLFGGGGGKGPYEPTQAIGRMLGTAASIAGRHYPYVYGGGHGGGFGPTGGGYDCSGYVSAILGAAGLLNSPTDTGGLKVFGEGGDGKHVTIGVRGSTGRQAHTMIEIAGKFFESGSGHGAAVVGGWSGGFPIHRHPPGLAEGGWIAEALRTSRDLGWAQALDPQEVGWGLARGGILPFVGSFDGGGLVPQDGLGLLHRGEYVLPDSSDSPGLVEALREHSAQLSRNTAAVDRLGPHTVDAIEALADVMSERIGDRAGRRGRTAGRGVTAIVN